MYKIVSLIETRVDLKVKGIEKNQETKLLEKLEAIKVSSIEQKKSWFRLTNSGA